MGVLSKSAAVSAASQRGCKAGLDVSFRDLVKWRRRQAYFKQGWRVVDLYYFSQALSWDSQQFKDVHQIFKKAYKTEVPDLKVPHDVGSQLFFCVLEFGK